MVNQPDYSKHHLPELKRALTRAELEGNVEEQAEIQSHIDNGGYKSPVERKVVGSEFTHKNYKLILLGYCFLALCIDASALLLGNGFSVSIAFSVLLLVLVVYQHTYLPAALSLIGIVNFLFGSFFIWTAIAHGRGHDQLQDILVGLLSIGLGIIFMYIANKKIEPVYQEN